jgi:polyhydroxyalkanoate synthesis repressor PhaR
VTGIWHLHAGARKIAALQHQEKYSNHDVLCQYANVHCAGQHSPKWEFVMSAGAVVIKKYGNRRLYDTAGSRYVNLDDIAALVREGRDLQVLDAKTGKDLTRITLTQIITEDAKDKPTGLPLELLRQLIVASDEVRQEFVMWYLKSAFDAYQKVQDAVQIRLGDMQSAILSPLDTMKKFLGAAPTAPSEGSEGNMSEIQALRARVAELEGRAKGSGTKQPSKKKKTAKTH